MDRGKRPVQNLRLQGRSDHRIPTKMLHALLEPDPGRARPLLSRMPGMSRERTNGDRGQVGDDQRGSLRHLQMQRGTTDVRQASLSGAALSRFEDRPRSWRVLSALQR